jgi:thymidylate kinase
MPRADLVLRLDVSLEVALHRNRERIKLDKEGDDFVELRHALWQKHIFPCDDVVTINTGLPINEVIRTVRQEIWKRL